MAGIGSLNLNFINDWADTINNLINGQLIGVQLIGWGLVIAGVITLTYFLIKYK